MRQAGHIQSISAEQIEQMDEELTPMRIGLTWTPVCERAMRQGATLNSCSEVEASVWEVVMVLGWFWKNVGVPSLNTAGLAKRGDTAATVCICTHAASTCGL